MRFLAFFLALAGLALAAEGPAFVEAAEFPYYQFPQPLWERELVWLKNLGVDTVVFSIPWNWHQLDGGELDLSGRTSPRRDLMGFVRLLKRVGLRAWIREEAGTTFHPSSTCRMGPADDPGAVVDHLGRVHGVAGLRVADAAIFPTSPRANLHFTVVAAAEKLADAIAEQHQEASDRA